MNNFSNKYLNIKKIPFYIFFDVFNIIAAIFIVNLFDEEIEIWYLSYFFVYILFCLAVFLKQYDKEYLFGLSQYKKDNFFEWIVMFCAMLFSGWFASGALLAILEFLFDGILTEKFLSGDMTSYTVSAMPLMLLYPLVFGFFPFSKAKKKYLEKLTPIPKRKKVFLKILPDWIIFIFSVYLLVFYFYILSSTFDGQRIASMELVERAAVWGISMAALLIMYLPARMHFFFDSYGNRQNKISLIITILIISIYSMTGIDVL